ncbi:MAG: amidase family protein, partial [Geminicoccaceae bacterium]
RLPAAYCGVVGYKPTTGLLSNVGIEPLCGWLDQIGPLARSVADIRILMEVLCDRPAGALTTELGELRFGRLVEFDEVELSDDVRRAFENAVYRLHQADVEFQDVSIEGLQPDRLRRAGLLLAEAEAAEHFAEDRVRFSSAFSDSFTAMLDYGAGASSEKLDEAENLLEHVRKKFNALFANVDLLIAPTAPQTAFSFDDEAPATQADLTALANIAGAPAISLPILSADLPVGLQIIGRCGADALVLRAAELMEHDLNFKGQPLNLEEMA